MGIFKKNNSKEISELLTYIREKYDAYITIANCSSKAYISFEERYTDVLKARVSVEAFLIEEKDLIDNLYKNYIRKQKQIAEENAKMEEFKERDLLSEIANRHSAKIARYPSAIYFEAITDELEKLFGAMKYIQEVLFPPVDYILRNSFNRSCTNSLLRIESALYQYVCRGASDVPDALDRYKICSAKNDSKALEIENKEILKKVSTLLCGIESFLNEQINVNLSLTSDNKIAIKQVIIYIETLIEDFRLFRTSDFISF